MASVKSSLIYKTITAYRITVYREFLQNFGARLAGKGQSLQQRRQETETGLAKEEVEAFNSWAQDFFQDHGVKTWGGASENYKNFATYVFKTLREFLPKVLAQKIKKEYKLDLAPQTLRINPEAYRDIVLINLFEFLEDNPKKIEGAMLKAHTSSQQLARIDRRTGLPIKETEGEKDKRRYDVEQTGFAESYFVPKADERTLKKLDAEGKDIEDMEPGSVDKYVLGVLKGYEGKNKNIKWKFEGFDENRITFSLPELFGDRTFVIAMPFDVKQIRDPEAREDIKKAFKKGTYTFKVNRVGKNGATLQFVEQAELVKERILPDLKRGGLDKKEINRFFNIVAKMYADSIRSMPIEALGERFGGGIELKPGMISGVSDLADLIEMGEKGELEKSREKSRGLEQVVRKKEVAEGEEFEKGLEHEQALSDLQGLQKLLAHEATPAELREITELLVDQLPKSIQPRGQGKYGLPSLLLTKPVSSYILKNIVFNKSTPTESKGKEQPWFRLVTDWLYEQAHTNPTVRKLLSDLLYLQATKGGKKEEPGEEIKGELKKKPTEKDIQEALTKRMAAALDISSINKMLRGKGHAQAKKEPTEKDIQKALKGKAPVAPTAPTAPGAIKRKPTEKDIQEALQGEPTNRPQKKTVEELAEEFKSKYEQQLPQKPEAPEEKEIPTKGKVMSPEEVRKYFNELNESTINVALQRYLEELNKIIKNKLSDHPLVKKALIRRESFLSYLKPDLERFVADILNEELKKHEEIGQLTGEQAQQWDDNQTKAEEYVSKYIKNPDIVKKDPLNKKFNLSEKLRQRIFKRYQKSQRQANAQQDRYKTVVAFAYRKLKSLEKDS